MNQIFSQRDRFRKAIWLVIGLFFTVTTSAKESEKIVITANRSSIALEQFAGSVTLITQAELERYQYRYLDDVLSGIIGLYTASSGGTGAQTSVFMRGAESNHVLVMVDGMEVTDPAFGNVAFFEQFQVNGVERIEILRGPYSAQHGSSAIGGIIHIVTRRGQDKGGINAAVEYGSFDSERVLLSASGRNELLDFFASAGYFATDGESFTARRLSGAISDDDSYRNSDAKINFGIRVSDFLRLDLMHGQINSENEYDSAAMPFEASEPKQSRDEKRTQATLSTQTEKWDAYWNISRFRGKARQSDGNKFMGERDKFAWHNDFTLSESWRLLLGVETETEKLRNSGQFSSVNESGKNRSVYAEARWQPTAELLLTVGLRHDNPDRFDSESSGQIGMVHQISDAGLTVRAAYGTAFKAPSLSEQFGFGGNTALSPEQSGSWEVGLYSGGLSVYEQAQSMSWSAVYFNSKIADLIAYDFADARLENIHSASIDGLELLFALDMSTDVRLELDYTLLSSVDQDGQRLLRRPLRQANLRCSWQIDEAISLALRGHYTGPRTDFQRDTLVRDDEGGHTVFYLTAGYQVTDDSRLSVRVNNLLDKNYEPVDGFNGGGRGIYLSWHSSFH